MYVFMLEKVLILFIRKWFYFFIGCLKEDILKLIVTFFHDPFFNNQITNTLNELAF